ncbi:MAG: metal-dependent transcriptional regulator [Methanolinea sp.]|nr:metal-dependent transcriptional regulator [Methanolinea sp.]
MKTSTREDFLEALCVLSRTKSNITTIDDLSLYLSLSPVETRNQLGLMEQQGDLHIQPEDRVELTEQGSHIGCRVMRKHQVLECFLSEILGMDPGTASEEACVLEHDISDEAVERLDRYIKRPGGRGFRMQRRWPHMPTLLQFPEGTELKILTVKCPGGCQRLSDMGIFPGERIKIIHTLNNKAVVIQVKGCDIALSPEIASCIFVEKT